MDDLRARFAALDRVAVPDVWPEVARRVSVSTSVAVGGGITTWRGRRTEPGSALRLALILAGLIAALAVGAVTVGSLLRTPAVIVLPTPSPTSAPTSTATSAPSSTAGLSTLDCAAAQASAARTATGWATRVPPDEAPMNGWLATWVAQPVPTVVLVDAATSETCVLLELTGFETGSVALSWSPDGQALAIRAEQRADGRQVLYVWSRDGLTGTLVEGDAQRPLGPIEWAGNSATLSVTQTPYSILPAGEPSVWIAGSDGSTHELRVACGDCSADSALLSADGSRVLVETFSIIMDSSGTGGSGQQGLALGHSSDDVLDEFPGAGSLLAERDLLGWIDNSRILLRDYRDGWLVDIAIDDTSDSDVYEVTDAPLGAAHVLPGLAPDGSAYAQVRAVADMAGELVVTDTATDEERVITELRTVFTAISWSPDSRMLAFYVEDGEEDEKGLWTIGADGSDLRRIATDLGPRPFSASVPWQPVWP